MNVLLITGDSEIMRDGSPAQAALLQEAAQVNKLMVIIMNSRHRHGYARKVNDHLWLFPMNAWTPFDNFFRALGVIRKEIFFRNRLQADLIVADDPLLAGFVAVVAARRYKKPLHIYVRHNIFSRFYVTSSPLSLLRSVIGRIFIGFANSISVASESTRATLIRRDPVFADRVTTVQPYIDVDAVRAKTVGDDLHLKYTQFRALLLVIAPLSPEQNIKLAIGVLVEISKYHNHIGLVIVGSGIERFYLARYAKLKGVGDSVMFEPPQEDMTSLYKSAFALVVPSLFEAFESTIEDAAAAGCVMISSPVGNAPKLIENKENGYLCDPHAPLEYVDAINMLLNNEKLRMTMKERIAEKAKNFVAEDKDVHEQTRLKAWQQAVESYRGY